MGNGLVLGDASGPSQQLLCSGAKELGLCAADSEEVLGSDIPYANTTPTSELLGECRSWARCQGLCQRSQLNTATCDTFVPVSSPGLPHSLGSVPGLARANTGRMDVGGLSCHSGHSPEPFFAALRCEKGFFPAEGEGLSPRGSRGGSSPAVSALPLPGERREPALGWGSPREAPEQLSPSPAPVLSAGNRIPDGHQAGNPE